MMLRSQMQTHNLGKKSCFFFFFFFFFFSLLLLLFFFFRRLFFSLYFQLDRTDRMDRFSDVLSIFDR